MASIRVPKKWLRGRRLKLLQLLTAAVFFVGVWAVGTVVTLVWLLLNRWMGWEAELHRF